jgi:hypothetical protein
MLSGRGSVLRPDLLPKKMRRGEYSRHDKGCRIRPIFSILRGGHCLPFRVGVRSGLRLFVVIQRTVRKVGFEFRQGAIFPFLGLAEERGALKRTDFCNSICQKRTS